VGRAIALELARAGCDLVATWREDRAGIESLASEVRALGRDCTTMQVDLSSVDPRALARDEALRRIDVVALSAAQWRPSPAGAIDPDAAVEDYRVNALVPLRIAEALAPTLAASSRAGGGCVVAIGDAHAAGVPVRGFGGYLMSKAALHHGVLQLAVELAPRVRVNGVLPGVVAWPDSMPEDRREAILSRVPLGRAGVPEDVARAVRFLALEAPFITGALLPVDGGRSIR
jgi:pteridine reductase